jgi:hypothetical protein
VCLLRFLPLNLSGVDGPGVSYLWDFFGDGDGASAARFSFFAFSRREVGGVGVGGTALAEGEVRYGVSLAAIGIARRGGGSPAPSRSRF